MPLLQANSYLPGEKCRTAVWWQPIVCWMALLKQARLRWSPALGQPAQSGRGYFFLQVREYLLDHHRVFNTSDYLDGATAFAAGFNVDMEHPFQSLCPS